MQFADLNLSSPILRALEIEGYETATPIQAQAIPHVLKRRDVLGCAQTGTGKTAAFALPILERLHATPASADRRRPVRALVLCPTRELAAQIGNGFRAYGRDVNARYSVIFGGVSQHGQVDSLRSGVDIIVACPGRLLDLMNQRHVDLSKVDTLVLDEADRMLDMGFIHDIRRIVAKLPTDRQTLFFSATMPSEIRKLADSILRNPVTVSVTPVSSTAERIEERVYFVGKNQKTDLLAHLVKSLPMYRSIVFTRTKHGADKVVRRLERFGIVSAAIHGNKSQNNRSRTLHAFKENKIGVLVATDIAARGIDIDGVTHVVNFDMTHEPETYVHRIGRTARAGASGNAVSFCDVEERSNLAAIEKLIKRKIPVAATPLPELNSVPAEHSEAPRAERDPRAGRGAGSMKSHRREPEQRAPHGSGSCSGAVGQRRSPSLVSAPHAASASQYRGEHHRASQHRVATPIGGSPRPASPRPSTPLAARAAPAHRRHQHPLGVGGHKRR